MYLLEKWAPLPQGDIRLRNRKTEAKKRRKCGWRRQKDENLKENRRRGSYSYYFQNGEKLRQKGCIRSTNIGLALLWEEQNIILRKGKITFERGKMKDMVVFWPKYVSVTSLATIFSVNAFLCVKERCWPSGCIQELAAAYRVIAHVNSIDGTIKVEAPGRGLSWPSP
jgi:hypothetical protein